MNEPLYRTNRHSCFFLQYHLVVVTKYRHPVIQDVLRQRLIDITHDIFTEKWGCNIIAVNTDKDHIHVLFEAPPHVQLSALVNNFKTVSSRLLRKEFAEQLLPYYWKPVFWSQSYFVCTVSEKSDAVIEQYIANQGKEANPS